MRVGYAACKATTSQGILVLRPSKALCRFCIRVPLARCSILSWETESFHKFPESLKKFPNNTLFRPKHSKY